MSNTDKSESGASGYDGYHKYDSEVAKGYDSSREIQTHWRREDEFIQNYLKGKKIDSLLDLPVGTGRFFRHFNNVSKITGVDISEEMLNEARKKLTFLPKETTVLLERGDVFNLRFADAEFDLVIVFRLLHLIPEDMLLNAIKELCRVTRGKLIVQVYGPQMLPTWWQQQRKNIASWASRFQSSHPAPEAVPPSKPETKPWCHIRAYYHEQSLIDSKFSQCGFIRSGGKLLDVYEGSNVNASIYSRA